MRCDGSKYAFFRIPIREVLCILLCLYLIFISIGCCCREGDPSLEPVTKSMPLGGAVDGLACGLILHQPVLSSTLPFSGGIRLKNVSRRTIYIETPRLRGTGESPVSLEWEGHRLPCSILSDGLEAYPDDIIELKPGRSVLLEYSWQRNPALEDSEMSVWPEPGYHGIKARLVFPEPAGDIMGLPIYNAGGRLFHGTIASNKVYAEVE